MRPLRYFHVDAFASGLFAGNPAGVCVLEGDEWLADGLMQRVAFENNLSETAFALRRGDRFGLRWFAPAVEVDLCGHATLAAAFVLFTQMGWEQDWIEFESRSGALKVERRDSIFALDFPSRPAERADAPALLVEALGRTPNEILKARDWMCVFEREEDVRGLQPRFDLLGRLDAMVIVTAPGQAVDFVSRFFAPTVGINEDPVTGSAHCTLIPYWAERLQKTRLEARQISRRGGELFCEARGERVGIGGRAVLYSAGEIYL